MTLVELFVRHSGFTGEQNRSLTEISQITLRPVRFPICVQEQQRRVISLFVRLLGVNLGFFLDYSGRVDAHCASRSSKSAGFTGATTHTYSSISPPVFVTLCFVSGGIYANIFSCSGTSVGPSILAAPFPCRI